MIRDLLLLGLILALHEAGHAVAALCLGHSIRGFARFPVSAGIGVVPPVSARDDVWIALAGPCVNLLCAWPFFALGYFYAAAMTATLGLLSLVPVRPQDGWHVLQAMRR